MKNTCNLNPLVINYRLNQALFFFHHQYNHARRDCNDANGLTPGLKMEAGFGKPVVRGIQKYFRSIIRSIFHPAGWGAHPIVKSIFHQIPISASYSINDPYFVFLI
jgi:hypothetical protein